MGDLPFGPDDLAHLAEKLGLTDMPDDLAELLQEEAQGYQFAAMVDRDPSRSERRQALKNIAELARNLSAAFQDLDAPTSKGLNAPIGPDELGMLADRAKESAGRIPNKGGDPKLARRIFVEGLAAIYEEVTNQEPSLSYDPKKGGYYSPFRDFVKAALQPLDPYASQGVEGDIGKVLRSRTKSS